jgi:hypothetical protein
MKHRNDLLKHALRRANWELRLERLTAVFERLRYQKRVRDRRRTARKLETRGIL